MFTLVRGPKCLPFIGQLGKELWPSSAFLSFSWFSYHKNQLTIGGPPRKYFSNIALHNPDIVPLNYGHGAAIKYCKKNKMCLMAQYLLPPSKDRPKGTIKTKKQNFKKDHGLDPDEQDNHILYRRSRYDRGKMTPHADAKLIHHELAEDSWLCSNVCPQYQNFNRGIWKTLENKAREYSGFLDEQGLVLEIICGSMFDDQVVCIRKRRAIGQMLVPANYFKILIVREKSWKLVDVTSIVLPHLEENEKIKDRNCFQKYATSPEKIQNQIDCRLDLVKELLGNDNVTRNKFFSRYGASVHGYNDDHSVASA